jgi:cell envelope opacity-associated protein A
MQSVQCMFDKKHASVLSKLEKGQLVTVQGRYNGSVIAMRIVDCVLIP